MVDDAVRRIAEACLEAPLRGSPWSHVAEAIATEFTDKCVLVSLAPGWSPMGPTFSAGVDPDEVARAEDELHRSNPWASLPHRLEEGYFGLGYLEFTPAELRAGRFYNEWMRPAGLASDVVFGGFPVISESGPELLVALLSRTGTRAIVPAQLEVGARIMPLLKRTFRLVERLCSAEGSVAEASAAAPSDEGGRWSRAVLDRLQIAAIVTDASARVLYLNHAADALLTRGDEIRLRGSLLHTSSAFDTRKLLELVARAASNLSAVGGSLACSGSSVSEPLQLLVTPLPTGESGPGRALLLALPPPIGPEQALQVLRRSFGLTRAEAELTLALARHLNLREAADACSISYETARTYFKRAADKLGVRSQAAAIECARRLTLAR